MKPITMQEADFGIEVMEESVQVRGAAIASGNPELDKKTEDLLLEELDAGNIWAWCTVRVVAEWNGIQGDDYLGCCSYKSREDFIANSGYYEDMRTSALADLNAKVQKLQRCS